LGLLGLALVGEFSRPLVSCWSLARLVEDLLEFEVDATVVVGGAYCPAALEQDLDCLGGVVGTAEGKLNIGFAGNMGGIPAACNLPR